jgi:hypothetical protein
MQKKTNKKIKKQIHHGYVLYDQKLNEKKFEQSFLDVIHLHDVFFLHVKHKKVVKEDYEYSFDKINFLDQIALESDLEALYFTRDYKTPAAFKWIYFNHELRGFYYAFDQVFFDVDSVNTFMKTMEEAYFNGKHKPLASSYYHYLNESGRLSESHFTNKQFIFYEKKYEINEHLKEKIDRLTEKYKINYAQLFTGILGTYYLKQFDKELVFDSKIVKEETHKIGYFFNEDYFKLKKSYAMNLPTFFSESWKTTDKKPSVTIVLEEKFKDLKGKVVSFANPSSQLPLMMVIKNNESSLDIVWHYHKNKYKKDEIHYLMLKFNHLLHCFLDDDLTLIKDIDLTLPMEKEILLKYGKAIQTPTKKLRDKVQSIDKIQGKKVAIETNNDQYTYGQLQNRIDKISSVIKNKMSSNNNIYIDSKDPLDLYGGHLAALKSDVFVVDDLKSAGWILSKGFFSYKFKRNFDFIESPHMNLKGYNLYLSWIINYISINSEERTLINGNFLTLGVPTILAGGSLCIGQEKDLDQLKCTLAVFHEKPEKDYPSLRKSIVTNKNIKVACETSFYGVQVPLAVPFVAMGKFNQAYIKNFEPAKGVGLVFLDRNMKLKPVNVRGQAYIFGLGAPKLGNNEVIKLDGFDIDHVSQLGLKGRWFYDGSIRI